MTAATASAPPQPDARIRDVLRKYWGYDTLRPLQAEAIKAGLDHRDSLVVLPTGGGKSLCYQVPPALAGRTDVVVSPLISLMKDQVDALTACGYPAAALHSGLGEAERRTIQSGIAAGKYRLLFVAPERLLTPWFLSVIERLDVRAFAIDEAHCISQWGHDFRPEYRQLSVLKERFPGASVHAYTATATPQVRADIIQQLRLRDPNVLVGVFDRPNLVYRVQPRTDANLQVLEAVRRHHGEAVIVYCISRRDTEATAAFLRANGVRAAAYHAGLAKEARAKAQDDFARERLDVVVATVAFGMGIDRSNVRCVIHAALPKSVEHYQQETGRAGRDGLEAECLLLYSPGDVKRWEWLLQQPATDQPFGAAQGGQRQPDAVGAAQMALLERMQRFASASACRHAALSRYFGQEYAASGCGACDICLGEVGGLSDGSGVARQVLACVRDLQERFGVGHLVDVLLGARTGPVRRYGHEQLDNHGALKGRPKAEVQGIVFQLVDQALLERTAGDRPVLKLNDASREVLDGRREVLLREPKPEAKPAAGEVTWQDVDRGLFDRLRDLRRRIADERDVPAFVIFGDAVLRELARVRPTSLVTLREIKGIGDQKLADLGGTFVEEIAGYCREQGLTVDNLQAGRRQTDRPAAIPAQKALAFRLFARGDSIDAVAARIGRARGTTAGYLAEFVLETRPQAVSPWVSDVTYERVAAAARRADSVYLRPVFEALDGEVPYDDIRVVLRHIEALAGAPARPNHDA